MKSKMVAKIRFTITCDKADLSKVTESVRSVKGCKIIGIEWRGNCAPEDSSPIDAIVK